jgi:alkylation response protein AidB-like acyl-CoA dehydrogenase
MLSDIEIARHRIDMALAALAQPVDTLDTGAVAAARANIAPALCHAANQVMQVHGGIGYMRDAGPEKLVRDQNMLKLASGGTRDLHAFLAGWTGACA